MTTADNNTLFFSPARLLIVGMDVNREQQLIGEIQAVQADTQTKNGEQSEAMKELREKQKLMDQLSKQQVHVIGLYRVEISMNTQNALTIINNQLWASFPLYSTTVVTSFYPNLLHSVFVMRDPSILINLCMFTETIDRETKHEENFASEN